MVISVNLYLTRGHYISGEETIEELKNDLELVNKIISIIETYNCNIAVNLSITKEVENAIDTIYVGITNTFKESEVFAHIPEDILEVEDLVMHSWKNKAVAKSISQGLDRVIERGKSP